MRIDSHQHFWRYNQKRDAWMTDEMSVLKRDFLPPNLLPELSANWMHGTIAVQADQSEAETKFLLNLGAEHNWILGVVGWVDLCSPNLSERLAYFSQFKQVCGFRHIVQAERDDRFMLRTDFLAGVAALQRFDFSYDVLIYPRQLPAALELVEKFPQQRFVVDHLAKPQIRSRMWSPWAEQIRLIGTHKNVYCKLSGLITEADWSNWREDDFRPYLDVVFDAFGPDRLMFGSDWPVCLLAGNYGDTTRLVENYIRDLSAAHQKGIFGLNAAKFYGLKTSGQQSAIAR
jgi:L-fuconolactonase